MGYQSPHVGRTIRDIFWEELDDIMDRLKAEGKPDIWTDEDGNIRYDDTGGDGLAAYQAWAETRGQAQGVAYCLAVLTNPYEPDIDAIREEARKRWDKRHKEV